jgi:hypothetical protein
MWKMLLSRDSRASKKIFEFLFYFPPHITRTNASSTAKANWNLEQQMTALFGSKISFYFFQPFSQSSKVGIKTD